MTSLQNKIRIRRVALAEWNSVWPSRVRAGYAAARLAPRIPDERPMRCWFQQCWNRQGEVRMSTRAELEAALAKAESDWRRAGENLDRKQAERARANDEWAKADADRRRAATERRKAGSVWNPPGIDRRMTDSDRRRAGAVRDQANAEWDQALAARREARAVWDQARAALDALDRAAGKG
jgi:hypothetical protein